MTKPIAKVSIPRIDPGLLAEGRLERKPYSSNFIRKIRGALTGDPAFQTAVWALNAFLRRLPGFKRLEAEISLTTGSKPSSKRFDDILTSYRPKGGQHEGTIRPSMHHLLLRI